MMTEAVVVDFQFILVEEFVSARRAVALHGAEVLAPARASCILFQSLLLGASAKWRLSVSKVWLGPTPSRQAHLFWNHTCTTRISRPVSCDSCSLTCRAGFGLLLYAVFSVSSCLAVIVVRGRLLG